MTGPQFKRTRLKLGWSVPQAAALFSVERSAVYNWESGRRRVPGPARVLLEHYAAGRLPNPYQRR